MKEINERWDCQWEMIPNHFCVILDKTSFFRSKTVRVLWENFEKITIKVRGYCLIKEMPIVYM